MSIVLKKYRIKNPEEFKGFALKAFALKTQSTIPESKKFGEFIIDIKDKQTFKTKCNKVKMSYVICSCYEYFLLYCYILFII